MKKETSDTLRQAVLFTDELHYSRNKVLRNTVSLISGPDTALKHIPNIEEKRRDFNT